MHNSLSWASPICKGFRNSMSQAFKIAFNTIWCQYAMDVYVSTRYGHQEI